MNKIINEIKQICPQENYEIGYASLSGLLKPEYAKYKYGISLARKLDDQIIDQISNGPTDLYYDLYCNINNELNLKTELISNLLKTYHIEAYPIKATVEDGELEDIYKKTLRYPFSHKLVATRSGIGWIGKTDLLVTSRFGPRVRLASILMTANISDSGVPIDESQCGIVIFVLIIVLLKLPLDNYGQLQLIEMYFLILLNAENIAEKYQQKESKRK